MRRAKQTLKALEDALAQHGQDSLALRKAEAALAEAETDMRLACRLLTQVAIKAETDPTLAPHARAAREFARVLGCPNTDGYCACAQAFIAQLREKGMEPCTLPID